MIKVSLKFSSSSYHSKITVNNSTSNAPVLLPINVPCAPSASVKRKYAQWCACNNAKKDDNHNTDENEKMLEEMKESLKSCKEEINLLLKKKEEEIQQISTEHKAQIDKLSETHKSSLSTIENKLSQAKQKQYHVTHKLKQIEKSLTLKTFRHVLMK